MRNVLKAAAAAAAALVLAAGLTACTGTGDDLAAQYRSGDDKGYISGDGAVKEYSGADRPAAIHFSGTLDDGSKVSSDDYAGKVTVINFWYAECAPCRQEAPILEKALQKSAGEDVAFLGVNTYNQAATARSFAKEFDVTYPSVIDVDTKSVTAAFAGIVPLSATPSTVVLGPDGRPTARIVGAVPDASILTALIKTALGEKS